MDNPFEQYDSEENLKQYELEQRQRTLERRIRNTKRETMNWKNAAEKAADPAQKAEFTAEYERKAALLQKQNKAYNDFCESTGQKKRSERISIAKWDRQQAAQARAAARRQEKSVAISPSNDKIKNIGFQFFAKKSEDFPTVVLARQEYAHVMSEIATNITKEQSQRKVFSKPIGKYIYTVENNGFGNYRIIKKVEITEDL